MIRQGGAQLERFCQKSGNFLPLWGWPVFWAYLHTHLIEI
jgi:hypothetical protein